MFVLSRKVNEAIAILLEDGRRIDVTLCEATHGKSRIGIKAPRSIVVSLAETLSNRMEVGLTRFMPVRPERNRLKKAG